MFYIRFFVSKCYIGEMHHREGRSDAAPRMGPKTEEE
jgi:hypothetical protein